MHNRRSRLTYTLGTLAIGAALVLISSVGAWATDPIDDPARHPHLKSWSNVIPNATKRFVVLADFNNAAVLDRETGLVWEKAPSQTPESWWLARDACAFNEVGSRRGWRLPSVVELSSLADPTQETPALPPSHPFTLPSPESVYWSATTRAGSSNDATDVTDAWVVSFLHHGSANAFDKTRDDVHVWCVRGAMNADQY